MIGKKTHNQVTVYFYHIKIVHLQIGTYYLVIIIFQMFLTINLPFKYHFNCIQLFRKRMIIEFTNGELTITPV